MNKNSPVRLRGAVTPGSFPRWRTNSPREPARVELFGEFFPGAHLPNIRGPRAHRQCMKMPIRPRPAPPRPAPPRSAPLRALTLIGALCLAAACSSATPTDPPEPAGDRPPGPDVSTPFPIDRGDDGPETPGSYKGLPLRLVARDEPAPEPVDGRIGVVCIGMSNSSQECEAWIQLLAAGSAGTVNPAVHVANCAVGGHALERWIDPAYDGALWGRCLAEVLPQAGLHPDQVRVLYHKAANQFTTIPGMGVRPPYPHPDSDFFRFRENLGTFAERVPEWFPAVVATYTSSRSYGGYAGNPARGEPLSYESGHALNAWLAQNPTVAGVRHLWGPYLWAPDCGTGITNGSGHCYVRTDYVQDGVHPSPAGRARIAEMIHARFLEEAWYRGG